MLFKELPALLFALIMKIGLLKTGSALFGAMRLLLFLVNVEEQYVYGERAARLINPLIFDGDRRDTRNLCFEVVLVGIKRGLIIFRLKRLLKSVRMQKKSSLY
jgi:hypothetical protein